jgi:hypothetical protein
MAKKNERHPVKGHWFKSPQYSSGDSARGMSPQTLHTVGTVAGPTSGKATPDTLGVLHGDKETLRGGGSK